MNLLNDDNSYNIGGRYTWQDKKLCLAFSASYLEFFARATRITAEIESDGYAGEETLQAWLAVFVNGGEVPEKRFALEKGRREYELFASGEAQDVRVRVMKYSENAFASVCICSVTAEGGCFLPCKKERRKLIEFIGDSITCGYGIEGIAEKDTFTTAQENPWEAYACRTARLLDADFSLVSWSGNGLISHYVEDTVDVPRHDKPFLQELYPYADLELETRLEREPRTRWEGADSPDAIVIHVGTNDCSYARELPERNMRFFEVYMQFVGDLRRRHPQAAIVCILGIMDRRLNATLEEAVDAIRNSGDTNVFYLDMPEQEKADGMGTDYHPSQITHEKAAKRLSSFLNGTVFAR